MSLILSGSDGLSDVDGTAAAPAIRGTDTNTGIFFPAADTVATSVAGTEGTRLTSTGLGIGTTAPTVKLEAVAGTGSQSIGLFRTGDATAANNAGGGFNAASSATAGSRNARIWLDADGANFAGSDYFYIDKVGNSGDVNLIQQSNAAMTFQTNGSERARIDSSGNLLLGVTSFGGGATIGLQINATSSSSGAYAQLIKNSSGTEIFQMRCNGGLANFSANNVNLSDERTKTDIQNAGGYLAKICAIPVRTFKYKDQTDDLLNLGCIAQEVEAIAPELVDPSGFGETPEDGVPLKAIYQTDLQYALMKCIQEQQALITALTTRITALEGVA